MTKSIKFLLMLGCLIALFQICPTPDISADKDDDKDKPHSDEKEKPKSDNPIYAIICFQGQAVCKWRRNRITTDWV